MRTTDTTDILILILGEGGGRKVMEEEWFI